MDWADLTPAVSHALDQGEEVEFGVYRYEVCLNVAQGNVTTVREEALRQRPQGKGKWQRVFERNERGELSASKSFLMGGFKHLLNTLPPSASVLSSFAVFQHPTAKIFVDRLQSCLTNMPHGQPRDDSALAAFFANSPHLVTALNHDLRRIDVGVEQMQIVDTPTGPVPFFRHEGLQVDMPWGLESHGTQAFIRVFPFLAITLERGGVAIIDELDALLHPVVLPDILTWYYDKHQRNKFDAQLWMSCNSASLLDDLTKEQVVLCDKDRRGRSTVYSLMDVKSVRRDDNLYRKYLSGAYGAIPNIG